ncbi:putative RNA-binding Zn ribbon-like protein [Streptomyces aurantiacus]|uniref:CGNR zinc finger domain-containing protein n=1 Tax=Streptomyces aurantiacus TaxID=47760 RepID=UPI00278F0865|nr:CGNR zinc finger domain-containing protein [Streptomyces aurantiacus]MDQ0779044.1 putative RNA-binding Zn ribbon-like protein [Streptomyces aurantiacus]
MSWPATDRYDIEPAPSGLAFVQDFLNTLSAGKPRETDLLLDRRDAQAWLDEVWPEERKPGQQRSPVELHDADMASLRAFRDGLRNWLSGTTADAPAELTSAFGTTVRLGADGSVRTEPAGSGWEGVASLVLIEMFRAQQVGEWRRLKVCRSDRCRVTFFDRSRNNSGVWHDVRKCGHPANLRAFRSRQKSAASVSRPG